MFVKGDRAHSRTKPGAICSWSAFFYLFVGCFGFSQCLVRLTFVLMHGSGAHINALLRHCWNKLLYELPNRNFSVSFGEMSRGLPAVLLRV
jgi:hypothetical protein